MKYWLLIIGFIMTMFVIKSVESATFTVKEAETYSYIVMDGNTVEGDANRLRIAYNQAIKKEIPFSSNLVLNGKGGSILAMREVIKLIKSFQLNTMVTSVDECYSACATMWASGENIVLFDGGIVGFHFGYQPIEALKHIQDEWGYNGLRQHLVAAAFQEAAYDLHVMNLLDPITYLIKLSQTAPWVFWEITIEEAEEIFGATTYK